ncbi:hypothetical protein [Pseudoduganella sp. OTU4001]|uniref:hypothetical protein n=1 Tax=Pseudoduganella sp. OTU4001 TaxID=3043854 RepID=UPI00313B264F
MGHRSISNELRAALRGAFGLTCPYLGDELFDICASGFVAQHASSLQSYGDDFSGWLALHPSVRLLALDWNTMDVWRSLRRGAAAPEPRALAQPGHWLVWQREGSLHYRELAAAEADALLGFRPGSTASGAYLQQWLAQGVLDSG